MGWTGDRHETVFRLLVRHAGHYSGDHKGAAHALVSPDGYATGLKLTYKAYLKKRVFPRPDFTFEDEILERSSKALGRAV